MKIVDKSTDYDYLDRDSIVQYAKKLEKSSLREQLLMDEYQVLDKKGKGGFGEAVEEYYFGYIPNSRQEADFLEAGIELKVTPLKRLKSKRLSAKERLSITNINFMEIHKEAFEDSTLMKKLSEILLMFYEHDPDLSALDYKFQLVQLWSVPEEDLPTIKQDWETVVNKVRQGKAHELSSGDTDYLEACTKGAGHGKDFTKQPFSSTLAKRRNFALKRSYMDVIAQKGLANNVQKINREGEEEKLSLEQLVQRRFQPYIGLSAFEIAQRLEIGFESNRRPKNFFAILTKAILGVKEKSRIEEFEKANIIQKTIRLRRSGMPFESISFPAFKYLEIAEQDWEESAFYEALTQRFLFVIFQDESGLQKPSLNDYKLVNVLFWTMPTADLDTCAKDCFEKTRNDVLAGIYNDFPRITTNCCTHVRPHGRNSKDTYPTPQGLLEKKRSFWLNARYIKEQVELLQENRNK